MKINSNVRRCVFVREWVKLTHDELLSILHFKSVSCSFINVSKICSKSHFHAAFWNFFCCFTKLNNTFWMKMSFVQRKKKSSQFYENVASLHLQKALKQCNRRSTTNWRFKKWWMTTLHINTIKCKKLATTVSGRKNVTRFFVSWK